MRYSSENNQSGKVEKKLDQLIVAAWRRSAVWNAVLLHA